MKQKGLHINNYEALDLHSSANSINSPTVQKLKNTIFFIFTFSRYPDRTTWHGKINNLRIIFLASDIVRLRFNQADGMKRVCFEIKWNEFLSLMHVQQPATCGICIHVCALHAAATPSHIKNAWKVDACVSGMCFGRHPPTARRLKSPPVYV